MLTNASCTVYHKRADGGYDREFVPAVFWMDSRSASVKTGGIVPGVGVIVYFPEATVPKLTAQGDILVRGDCPQLFDNTSPATVSASHRALTAAYDIATVTDVDDKRYGTALRHVKVVAK